MKLILLATCATAFIVPAPRITGVRLAQHMPRNLMTPLRAAETPEDLLAQAAALRGEAQALETTMRNEQEAKMQKAIDAAFSAADSVGDGVVTVDELKATLEKVFVTDSENKRDASRFEALLASEKKYVEQLVSALDDNKDGVLQPEEFVPLVELRARMEEQFRTDKKEEQTLEREDKKVEEENATRAERLDEFEAAANKTDGTTRALAASAYILPLLDILPPPTQENIQGGLIAPLEQLSLAFHGFPFGGLLAFILLSNMASNAAAPRLQRFSARHAIVLDLASAVGLPLTLAGYDGAVPYVRGLFGAYILASVALAAFGKEASLVPGTGQLTKKFIDDFDATVRQVISATVGSGPFNITILTKPPSDEEDSKDE